MQQVRQHADKFKKISWKRNITLRLFDAENFP
jgi:hypothetical protein